MNIDFGKREVNWPGEELGELRESNDLLGDRERLRRRLAEDGYLLIRGLIDRGKVQRTREHLLYYMQEQEALVPGTPVLDGVMPKDGKSVGMMGRKGVTHHADVLATLAADELFEFYGTLFGETARTFDYKWLRAVGNEQWTRAHYDVVYMGRGSGNLMTCWLPLGDIPVEHGTLAILRGSHNLPSFEKIRQTYGRSDVDRDQSAGWFTQDLLGVTEQFGGQWETTNFQMGDILTFGMFTMHASTTNLTNRFRLSCDVRFQPAADPVDERWVGENPKGHYTWKPGEARKEVATTIAGSRADWGV